MKTKTLTLKEQKQMRAEIIWLKNIIAWYSFFETINNEQKESYEGFKERLTKLENTPCQ